ncbi:LLM class flavin-dependent oxidoreductase [Roseomonas hellenica]|uniref:LLM class flavin-dependent oxidoreductase n=1 Tax=Plastoroseomonas hellenica TaxID=2687306 RepID=A0ABS5F4J6_9PROT|nr:LLM class flavin-dependent oxidoreductase [Plastoroseomonas hellenica]MBR0667468.1 LLM class flavin-dependent oxidoreductase [Plastoroseomonas hellenica]
MTADPGSPRLQREILLNAFTMNTVGHVSPGLWTHPRDHSPDYRSLRYWTELARLCERGLLDGIFIADVLGIYDVHQGGPEAALRHATQVPINDPAMLVSAMALVTEHLGFGITTNLSWEAPYLLARRMSTLDHLTEGRIGWNIVTGYLDSAARAMGLPRVMAHDARYDLAEDYMQVVYKLWEGSWEDGAVRRDRAAGIFVDPARVHRIRHQGPHFDVDAIHLCEPSPQRTPVLYQAGTSSAGRGFAGRHAECVFVSGPSAAVIAPRVAALRAAAAAAGRAPEDLRVFSGMAVIVAATRSEAEDRHAEYLRHGSPEGALALMSGWTGLDFGELGLDDEVRRIESDAMRTAFDNIARTDASRAWTVREVADFTTIGGIAPVITGDAAGVADAVEAWVEATGVDGLNLSSVVMPETFEAIVEHLVPELQRRGRYKRAYAPGTLRRKLFGRDRLEAPHPAAACRAGGKALGLLD